MRLIPRLILLAALVPSVVPAGDLNDLARAFSRETGAHQTSIPFFGLARFVVAVAHPAGVSDLRLAIFDDVHGRQREFIDTAEGLVNRDGWNRIVRVRSKKKGELTNIYTRREGNKLRMLVTTMDDGEAVFVEMRIRPEELMKFVDEHNHKTSS